jgi:deoxyribodipyrimidine photo-lyase
MRTLLWFRNDLRLNDNKTLVAALANSDEVVPVYILDERLLETSRWGFVRMAPFRLRFLLESLQDLQQHLREKGSDLIVKVGVPEKEIPRLAEQYDCKQVYASREYAHEEIQIENRIAELVTLRLFDNGGLYEPEALPFAVEKTPAVFTQFRKKVEKYAEVPTPLNTPDQIPSPSLSSTDIPEATSLAGSAFEVDKRAALKFKGGATAAFERLDYYFWDEKLLSTYKETRNGLIGGDYSSKFSPWLANGCISPRVLFHEVNAYEEEIEKNRSTYWLQFELLWREYFRLVSMQYGRKIFFPGGIQDKNVQWKNSDKAFRRWATGDTGDDFVDANMRELLFTGFMSNRGRQNVASYLVHQLKQDWRKGAAWFESLLVDYDVYSNYGNWMYAAGVGNDPRDRVFNTQKQAKMYDENGNYRRLWLKEEGADPAFYYRELSRPSVQQSS